MNVSSLLEMGPSTLKDEIALTVLFLFSNLVCVCDFSISGGSSILHLSRTDSSSAVHGKH